RPRLRAASPPSSLLARGSPSRLRAPSPSPRVPRASNLAARSGLPWPPRFFGPPRVPSSVPLRGLSPPLAGPRSRTSGRRAPPFAPLPPALHRGICGPLREVPSRPQLQPADDLLVARELPRLGEA